MEQTDLDNRFKWHDVDEIQMTRMDGLRSACLTLATAINTMFPDGREKSLAITKLEEVMFWANASISRRV